MPSKMKSKTDIVQSRYRIHEKIKNLANECFSGFCCCYFSIVESNTFFQIRFFYSSWTSSDVGLYVVHSEEKVVEYKLS